jgi:2-methylcitrate dehydratase PrpD
VISSGAEGRSLIERLIEDLVRDLQDPPQSALSAAERALLDFIGCARGGAVRGVFRLSPNPSPEALARTLGVLGSLLDRDDLHLPSLTHPGSVIWPTVLAIGSDTGATGDELLSAAVLGYEVIGRVGRALGAEHRHHWHGTATAGSIGAGAAAASILRLGLPELVAAVGHATSIAAGSSQCLAEGSQTKLVHRASAACNGILAARCAQAGLGATRYAFEGELGLFAATSSRDRAAHVLEGSDVWAIEDLVHRFYAASGFLHAAIEAAIELRTEVSEAIGDIEIVLPGPAFAAVGKDAPRTTDEAWWSAPYAVCVTLLYGADRLEDGGVFEDDALRNLLGRSRVRAGNDELSSVTAGDQRRSLSFYKGHPRLPLSIDEIAEKCRRLDPDSDVQWEALRASGRSPGFATELIELVLGSSS